MSDKPKISQLRILHDLQNHFEVPATFKGSLESQLSKEDQDRIERFVAGFKIEDWFKWTFSAMPWVRLLHGLDQQQFPGYSKGTYQVPDYLLVVETTALTQQPLLVEVKRVPRRKKTLKLPKSQIALCENYAAVLNIPLVFAIYWEWFGGWTLNTPDTFEGEASSRKLSMATAFELDCALILGDISFFVPQSLLRVSRFDQKDVSDSVARHLTHGRLVSDVAVLGDKRVDMTNVESAAIDSMITMKSRTVKDCGSGETEVVENPDGNFMPKLSSWISRHLATFKMDPTEEYANVSAHVITELMKKLGCPLCQFFPSGRSDDVKRLETLFITTTNAGTSR